MLYLFVIQESKEIIIDYNYILVLLFFPSSLKLRYDLKCKITQLCYSFQRLLSSRKKQYLCKSETCGCLCSTLLLIFFFSCFVFFGLQFKDMHSRCNKRNVWERSWSSQYMRIVIVYSILAMSTEMQWVVGCNIKMWFIFTVNAVI